jgi:hypothetical protein
MTTGDRKYKGVEAGSAILDMDLFDGVGSNFERSWEQI